MPRSMTTYASVRKYGDGWFCSMELRSVNGRYCDVSLRVPRWLVPLEDRIRKTVQARLLRGRIDLNIMLDLGEMAPVDFEPDVGLAKAYIRTCEQLSGDAGLSGKVDLPFVLANLKDVIRPRERDMDADVLWGMICSPLDELLDMANSMSEREGENLAADIMKRISGISAMLAGVGERADQHTIRAQEALIERLGKLLEGQALDQARVAQEAAILADRLDITEERVRADSHVNQFRALLKSSGLVGRKLDFLLQEIFREVNTMGVKSADAKISSIVVDIKAELEKIREQVQNLV